MKKNHYVFVVLTAIVFGLMSMTSNNAEYSAGKAGSNGSPGEGTCASGSCHNSFTLNSGLGDVAVVVTGLVGGNQYIPGQTYNVSVTVSQNGFGLFGFGLESLQSSGANAGTFTPGEGSHILNANVGGNSRATIAHQDNSGFSTGSKTWSFTWTAPVTPIPVTFYAAGNAANNNGGDGGDYIYTTSLELMPAPALEAPVIQYTDDLVICEGQSITLSIDPQPGISYNWQNALGAVVSSGEIFIASEADCYTVTASDDNSSATSETVCVSVDVVNSNFSGLAPMYCVGDGPVTLIPEVDGGVFSGPGVQGNVFDPSQVPVGDFQVGYTVTTASGCEFTLTQAVSVREILPADFVDLNDVYCSTDAPVLLNPLTSEGDFTGPVLSDVFDPNIAPGIYDITYTTGSGVCSASITQTVEVLASESSDFYIFPAFCASSPVDQMIPEVPGGVFTGTGVSGDVFDPATALLGDNDITYTLTQANGCISVTTQTVEVFAVANSDFTGLEPISCTTAGLVELVPVSLGGIFSGPGVSGSVFDPVAAGVGQHTILYDINLGDCQSETQVTTLVVEGPVADITVAGDLMSASAAQQGATYQWWNCDNQMPVEGATSAEFTITDPSQNGTYAVAVTLNGCEAMSECVLLLIESVDEVQQDWSAGIFPNPANTMLTVWSSRPATCAIYNSVGSRVSSFAIAATQRAIEVGELPSGLYHVVLDDGTSLRNHTLLIEH